MIEMQNIYPCTYPKLRIQRDFNSNLVQFSFLSCPLLFFSFALISHYFSSGNPCPLPPAQATIVFKNVYPCPKNKWFVPLPSLISLRRDSLPFCFNLSILRKKAVHYKSVPTFQVPTYHTNMLSNYY